MGEIILKFTRALLLLAVTGTAGAQIPTSTSDILRRPTDAPRSEIANSDAVFRDLVACVVRYQSARTRNLLETIPGSHRESALLASFRSRMESCYDSYRTGNRALMYQGNLLRGVIAEIFYRQEYPEGISPAAGSAAAAVTAWTRPRPEDGRIATSEMIHAMARCVMARRPADVRALLEAEPFSTGEMTAMQGLHADLSACLDTNVEFAASRQSLRGLLAEAALHYAQGRRRGFAPAGGGISEGE